MGDCDTEFTSPIGNFANCESDNQHIINDSVGSLESEHQGHYQALPIISKGMEFVNYEDAWSLYLAYSKMKGFGIRKHTTYKSRHNGETIYRTYVCAKQGLKKSANSDDPSKKRRREVRLDCKAKMGIAMDRKTHLWHVTTFEDNHNHELTSPSKVGNHRSHRKYHQTLGVKNLMDPLHKNGISNSDVSDIINVGAVTEEQTTTPQQVHDRVRKLCESNIGNECALVIQQLQDKRASDPLFFFSYHVDEDMTLRSVFWADSRSRTSYLEFNDVVCFDVTYKLNRLAMPFAPFTGVNHHRQSTLFGCALLADETEETFVWLFKEWLKCMFNKAPGAIITDQDGAICNAIKKVFPNTRHRYCSWHIHKHATEHLGLLHPINHELASDYHIWMKCETIDESEALWEDMKSKYGLKSDHWLVKMYTKRHHWVPAYLKDVFTAGLTSSQCSESNYSFFDGFVNYRTPLNDFVKQYDKALLARRRAEKDEDFSTMNSKVTCVSDLEWEAKAAMCYTRKVYEIFRVEFNSSQSYYKEKVSKESSRWEYLVGKNSTERGKWRKVILDVSQGVSLKCSCSKFETEGILCRHIMAIMRYKQIKTMPEHYLLRRWTIDARYQVCSIDMSLQRVGNMNNFVVTPLMIFSLQSKHHKLLEEASSSIEIFNAYNQCLDSMLGGIMKGNMQGECQVEANKQDNGASSRDHPTQAS